MARTEKYYLGRPLLDDIRRTVSRVDGLYSKTSGAALPVRLQTLQQPVSGGGTATLQLGRVTAAWNKNTLTEVVVYNSGTALNEDFGTPPTIIEGCVNKFADVQSGAWVLIGRAHNRYYLVSAECPPPEQSP